MVLFGRDAQLGFRAAFAGPDGGVLVSSCHRGTPMLGRRLSPGASRGRGCRPRRGGISLQTNRLSAL